jgi:hypothetical protein
MDSGFNWLGTDNDQVDGDRVFMPFYGAHFGWNHPWSSHWNTAPHAPTAPVSGPLFEGSGTGIVFGNSPQFPPEYRGSGTNLTLGFLDLGAGLSAPLLGRIIDNHGSSSEGFRRMFFVAGAVPLAVAVLWFVLKGRSTDAEVSLSRE